MHTQFMEHDTPLMFKKGGGDVVVIFSCCTGHGLLLNVSDMTLLLRNIFI